MRWFIWWLKGQLWWRWYKSYLKSDDWAKKRAGALKRGGYRCIECGSYGKETDWRGRKINPLQIDHKSYKHVGHELDEELRVLCLTLPHEEAQKGHGRIERQRCRSFLFYPAGTSNRDLDTRVVKPPLRPPTPRKGAGPCGSVPTSGGYRA